MRKSFVVRIISAVILIQILGVIIGLYFLAQPPIFHNSNIFDRLIAWDGGWYLGIAEGGYRWSHGAPGAGHENIAFFPLWPLVDRICIVVFGSFSKAAIVLASWVCGLASIFFFEKLARKTVGNSANTATVLYSFWPASSFYLMGYPTGITNICAIVALSSYFCGRVWLAAACIGLGTASAPTLVFVGFPIGLHYLITQLRTKPVLIGVRNAMGWMILSLWGVLAFIFYQQLAFGDPLAFIKIQAAWGYSPPLLEKLSRLSSIPWDIFEFKAGLNSIMAGVKEHASGNIIDGSKAIQGGIQNLVNFIFFVFCLIGLAAGSVLIKRHRLVLISSGCAVVFGYVWFIMLTNANMLSTPRLIFPALAMFLGLGALADKAGGFVKTALIAFFAIVSLLEMAFVAARYWVV